MTTLTANKTSENWDWADELFNGSDFAEYFDVDDCSFDPDTGIHYYFDATNNSIAVTPDGNVILSSGEQVDYEACPGCGCKPGDGITPDCNHPDGCGFFKAELA